MSKNYIYHKDKPLYKSEGAKSTLTTRQLLLLKLSSIQLFRQFGDVKNLPIN